MHPDGQDTRALLVSLDFHRFTDKENLIDHHLVSFVGIARQGHTSVTTSGTAT
jgi:hypothetical protein